MINFTSQILNVTTNSTDQGLTLYVTLIGTVLGSSVIAAIISNVASKQTNDKNQSLKYITEERGKWRDFVKKSVAKICSNKYKEGETKEQVITELLLSLNPSESQENRLDREIIKLLEGIRVQKSEPEDDQKIMLRICFSYLLKHDWERSKNETKRRGDKKEIEEKINQLKEEYTEYLDKINKKEPM
ncbi:hypothetical protein ACTHPJ_24065 [Paenibacillus amylolyticus]|uniref:hypothetical protein n=1 Tax=Paenibacillus TaxID=44249 RepID=UPI0030CF6DA9